MIKQHQYNQPKNGVNNIISLINVSKVYGKDMQRTVALNNISFESKQSEMVLILGPSGSGKTTLLTLIAGLLSPTSGEVILFEKKLAKYSLANLQQLRAQRVGFIFQNFQLIDALTAEENIELVLQFAGHQRNYIKEKIQILLCQLHIEHLAKKLPTEMSQGEKQRVAIARAIANEPKLILADEPTANLGSKRGFEVIQLLHQHAIEKHCCVIVASHDLRLIEYADRIIKVADGKLTED